MFTDSLLLFKSIHFEPVGYNFGLYSLKTFSILAELASVRSCMSFRRYAYFNYSCDNSFNSMVFGNAVGFTFFKKIPFKFLFFICSKNRSNKLNFSKKALLFVENAESVNNFISVKFKPILHSYVSEYVYSSVKGVERATTLTTAL